MCVVIKNQAYFLFVVVLKKYRLQISFGRFPKELAPPTFDPCNVLPLLQFVTDETLNQFLYRMHRIQSNVLQLANSNGIVAIVTTFAKL
jgi:hypothetical protein